MSEEKMCPRCGNLAVEGSWWRWECPDCRFAWQYPSVWDADMGEMKSIQYSTGSPTPAVRLVPPGLLALFGEVG